MPTNPPRPVVNYSRLWLALPLALYLLVPTREYFGDGLAFAIHIEKGLPVRELLSASHLIYPVAGLWLFKALLAIGMKPRALFVLQTVSAILAGACIPLVERALRRRGVSVEMAVTGALTFGFAAAWWKFATDANAYIPAILLLLCANDLLESRGNAWLAGLATAAAMLFHELAAFYLIVALMRLKVTRRALAYIAAAVVPAAGTFMWAYGSACGCTGFTGFAGWLTTHSPDLVFSFNALHDFAMSVQGTVRLFFGWETNGPLLVAGAGALAVALAAAVWRYWPRGKTAPPWRDSLPDLAWLGLYAAFLFFWMPQNTVYRVFYLAPLVLLAACRMDRIGLRLLCTVLFLWNAIFVIYPQSQAQNNVPLRFALDQRDRWPSGTPIAYHRFQPDLETISYFNPQASWIGLPTMDLGLLERNRAAAAERGQPIWLEAAAYDLVASDDAGRQWLAAHPVTHLMRFRDPKHEYRFYEIR